MTVLWWWLAVSTNPAIALPAPAAAQTVAAAQASAVGPLVRRGPRGLAGVCTAFVSATPTPRVITAAHCVAAPGPRLWLPGLQGQALQPQRSRWKDVLAFPSTAWRTVPGQDLAWASLAPGGPSYAWPQGPWPAVGDPLTVLGYPSGVGLTPLRCRYRGVAVLTGPRLRPALTCPGLPPGLDHTGFSGGPVLDAHGRTVGVLVSGSRNADGTISPAFEPLYPWLSVGTHTHPYALPWTSDQPHRLEIDVDAAGLKAYRIRNRTGTVWSHWRRAHVARSPRP